MKRLLGSAAAALALSVSPIAHAAAPARAQAPLEEGVSEMGGSFPLAGLVVLIAILAGAIFIVSDDDSPDSP